MTDDFHLEAGGQDYSPHSLSSAHPLEYLSRGGRQRVPTKSRGWGPPQHVPEEVAMASAVNTTRAGDLEHERLFLSPLYSFLSLHPRGVGRTVPAYVKYFLSILPSQVSVSRRFNCAMEMHAWETAPRVDAQASKGRTRIGGQAPVQDEEGRPDPWRSKWYSHEITKEEWPWTFEHSDKPPRVISTIEALAMGLKLSYGGEAGRAHTRIR